MAKSLEDIVLQVGLLDIYSLELPDTKMKITRGQNSWHVQLSNENLAGKLDVMDEDLLPIVIDLDYLRFFEDDAEEGADPFVDVIPQEIVAIDFQTDELEIDGEPFGSWKFSYRPTTDGASLNELTATLRGMEIIAPSAINWRYVDGEHYSGMQGVVEVVDLGESLRAWGYASSIEGSDFVFAPNLTWQGSPAMVDLDIVEGQMGIKGEKGRFVQAETGNGALKLLGIFDFAQLMKSGENFGNVVKSGHGFTEIKGGVFFNRGIVEVREPNPIVISGPGSRFKVGGTVDLETEVLDGEVVVTLPVNKNLPWYAAYAAIATGPLVGAGVLLATKVFEDQINQFSSAKYKVSGSIDAPEVAYDRLWSDQVREEKKEDASVAEDEMTEKKVVEEGTGDE